jgi:hypothetical protein
VTTEERRALAIDGCIARIGEAEFDVKMAGERLAGEELMIGRYRSEEMVASRRSILEACERELETARWVLEVVQGAQA